MPDVTYHGFEAMPQNCKFIEQVSLLFPVCLTLKFVAHTSRLQVPLVVKLGKRVRLHCFALGDSDGTVAIATFTSTSKS